MKSDTPDNDYILHSETETARLALQHQVIKDAMNGHCTADGTWIRDLQSSVPSSVASRHLYIGTDIEKSYFPTDTLTNTTFYIQDATKPWPEQWNGRFDLVHQRLSIAAAGEEKATKLAVQNLVKMLKPGGWIQIVDLQDWTANQDGPAWKDFTICLSDLIKSVGSSLERIEHVKGWFEELGLVNVEERLVEANFGTRDDKALEEVGKKSGQSTARAILGAATTFPQELLTLPRGRVSEIRADLEKEMSTDPTNAHWRYKVVWGRKPESALE